MNFPQGPKPTGKPKKDLLSTGSLPPMRADRAVVNHPGPWHGCSMRKGPLEVWQASVFLIGIGISAAHECCFQQQKLLPAAKRFNPWTTALCKPQNVQQLTVETGSLGNLCWTLILAEQEVALTSGPRSSGGACRHRC